MIIRDGTKENGGPITAVHTPVYKQPSEITFWDKALLVTIGCAILITGIALIAVAKNRSVTAHDQLLRQTAICENHGGQWINDGCFKLTPVDMGKRL